MVQDINTQDDDANTHWMAKRTRTMSVNVKKIFINTYFIL